MKNEAKNNGKDLSNNITFPDEKREVVILLDEKLYRLNITKFIGDYYKSFSIVYRLYDPDGSQENHIGYAKMLYELKTEMMLDPLLDNAVEIPDEHFYLDFISIDEKHRGIGTSFFNYILNDISNFNKSQKEPIKLILLRSTSKITLPFYKKFGARENCKDRARKYYESIRLMPMIIDNPKPIGEVPKELADNFDYSSEDIENPFTK